MQGSSPVERAINRVEDALGPQRSPHRIPWQHVVAAALRSLETALRTRAAELQERLAVHEPRAGVIGRIHRVRRRLDGTAGEAEALGAAIAASREPGEWTGAVRDLVRKAQALVEEETEVLLDAYWLDIGVGD